MFTQFSEISSQFIYSGKTKGVKRLLFHHNILSIKYQVIAYCLGVKVQNLLGSGKQYSSQ